MKLGSGIAVAVTWAGGCSSGWTPSLGNSICLRCGPRKDQSQKKKKKISGFRVCTPCLNPMGGCHLTVGLAFSLEQWSWGLGDVEVASPRELSQSMCPIPPPPLSPPRNSDNAGSGEGGNCTAKSFLGNLDPPLTLCPPPEKLPRKEH